MQQRYRRLVADRAMWSDFVVVSTPILHFLPCVVKAQEPMRVQAFVSELGGRAAGAEHRIACCRHQLAPAIFATHSLNAAGHTARRAACTRPSRERRGEARPHVSGRAPPITSWLTRRSGS